MSSKEVAKRPKRGPKTVEGRLAVRLNASTHGILSPRPIVNAYEKPQAWEDHRAAIVDSLSPEGGIEQVLAERVALMSWRLNRVTLYEAERLQESQENVIADVREARLHKGRIEAIFKGIDPDSLAVAIESHPLNVLDDLKMARAVYKYVCYLFEESREDTPVEGGYAVSILDLAARDALKMADYHAGVDADEREVRSRSEVLLECLPGIPTDAFIEDIDFLKERRRRVLPGESDLKMIARYEAHLSRQMYQALHELEALQKRRSGQATPLARVDVQT